MPTRNPTRTPRKEEAQRDERRHIQRPLNIDQNPMLSSPSESYAHARAKHNTRPPPRAPHPREQRTRTANAQMHQADRMQASRQREPSVRPTHRGSARCSRNAQSSPRVAPQSILTHSSEKICPQGNHPVLQPTRANALCNSATRLERTQAAPVVSGVARRDDAQTPTRSLHPVAAMKEAATYCACGSRSVFRRLPLDEQRVAAAEWPSRRCRGRRRATAVQ